MAKNYESVFLTYVRSEPAVMRCDQIGQISKFFPCREYFTLELYAWEPESLPPEFLLILAALPPKITIRSFWPRCDQMGQISKIFTWREYFAPELDASGPESLHPGFFAHFGRPTAQNFDSVFWTKVRPNGSSFQILPVFGRRGTKMGKKSWRETFGTIDVKVRSLSRSKFWEFDAPQKDRIHVLVACRSKRPRNLL